MRSLLPNVRVTFVYRVESDISKAEIRMEKMTYPKHDVCII